MLLGQNVNSYGKDHPEWSFLFHDLLAKIDAIPGLARVRFMTSHPVDITRELMEALRDLPSLCRLVHFPFQSGSNAILRKMHRMYTIEEYLDKVTQLRSLVPDVALGTDVIVGFCGETEEDFLSTKRLLEQLRFSLAFLFAYSPRQGTPAFRWKDDVSLQEKERRLRELLLLQEKVVAEQRQAMVGKTVEVLVEEVNFKEERLLKGRTRCWKNVLFPASPELIGTLQHVRLHSYSHQTLLGTLSTHIDEQRSP